MLLISDHFRKNQRTYIVEIFIQVKAYNVIVMMNEKKCVKKESA